MLIEGGKKHTCVSSISKVHREQEIQNQNPKDTKTKFDPLYQNLHSSPQCVPNALE